MATRAFERQAELLLPLGGMNYCGLATPYYYLGRIALDQDRYGSAEKLLKRAVEVAAESSSYQWEVLIDASFDLGAVYALTGRTEQAKAMNAIAIKRMLTQGKWERVRTRISGRYLYYWGIASEHKKPQLAADAEVLAKTCLSMEKKCNGDVFDMRENSRTIAEILLFEQKPGEAAIYYREALQYDRKIPHRQSSFECSVLPRLAYAEALTGHLAECRRQLHSCYQLHFSGDNVTQCAWNLWAAVNMFHVKRLSPEAYLVCLAATGLLENYPETADPRSTASLFGSASRFAAATGHADDSARFQREAQAWSQLKRAKRQ